jgi:cytochrome c oxidase cbb3-type subunit 1
VDAISTGDRESTPGLAETASGRAIGYDGVAVGYLFGSAAFLGIGSLVWLAAMTSVRFPNLLPFSHGHLRPIALTLLGLGWIVLGLSGGVYHVLPRLTGTPLAAGRLAQLALPGTVIVTVLGAVIVAMGWGDGREPFALPQWLDVLVVALFAVPALVTLGTLQKRHERSLYPTIWFVVAAVVWLPVLYVTASLPGFNRLASTLSDLAFTSGFLHVWGLGLATGLAYYVVPKAAEQPLASRQLAKVGFWSLVFGAIWSGAVQMVAGPLPEWLQSVAAVLGLALPVAAVANATNIAMTIGPRWRRIAQEPVLAAAAAGATFAALASILGSIAGFRSAAVIVTLTAFWDGVFYMTTFGGIALLFAAFAWHVLPNMVGRKVDARRAMTLVRRTAFFVSLTSLFLLMAGIAAGYGWVGGAFTGTYTAVGEGWTQASGLSGVLYGLAILFGVGALIAQVGVALSIYRILTSGRATVQEVLVPRSSDRE